MNAPLLLPKALPAGVEVEPPGVAAPLGEELELLRAGGDSARCPAGTRCPRILAVTVLPCAP